MYCDTTAAIEKRIEWLRWSKTAHYTEFNSPEDANLRDSLKGYKRSLTIGDTVLMNARFCELVDLARQTVPDDLKFEAEWLFAPAGWMWLEEPFLCPQVKSDLYN